MLALKDITKQYRVGEEKIDALNGISIAFRKSEFVSILGPSGCGKTTMLNIIGGLDRYTDGDLVINGRSTKTFSESDWNTYRNHSVGFVFQNYNLIPHQSVLANVELSLTLTGVSREERRRRAKEALSRVGLSDQISKKPNQLSGGQMQRVAIARALVNDPDILLADEPTGALDSETSVQIMDILREIASDRLVIMVTHNPDLAKEYSTRIIKVLDGRVIDDTDPYTGEEVSRPAETKKKKVKKPSMSFFTAFSLSLNNLMTKKGRTFMTAFAGSIGIIGIALILAVSSGTSKYINSVQEDTLTNYPIAIEAESVDISSLISSMMGVGDADEKELAAREPGRVYSSNILYEMTNSVSSVEMRLNDLKPFREYIENSDEFKKYSSEIHYEYDAGINVYTEDPDGKVITTDINLLMEKVMMEIGAGSQLASVYSSPLYTSMSGLVTWNELLPGKDGEGVSESVKSHYELQWGRWPEKYDEIILMTDEDGQVSDFVLYSFGYKPFDEMVNVVTSALAFRKPEASSVDSWSWEEMAAKEFRVVISADKYQRQEDGTYVDLSATDTGLSYLYGNTDISIPLHIVGIAKPSSGAMVGGRFGMLCYTAALTKTVMERTLESDVVKSQLEDPDTDVITGLPFKNGEQEEVTEDDILQMVMKYLDSLSEEKKAKAYAAIMTIPSEEYVNTVIDSEGAVPPRDEIEALLVSAYAEQMGTSDTSAVEDYISKMDDDAVLGAYRTLMAQTVMEKYAEEVEEKLQTMTSEEIIASFDPKSVPTDVLKAYYDRFMPGVGSGTTYKDTLKKLGYVDEASPDRIEIYVNRFSDKDKLNDLIHQYNDNVESEDQKITYTDYVGLIMSSVSTVINAITYVLIAFVAISLVVSSIMIGIITYVSVLERTKEIGILRSIGASKRDISRVFNAETFIEGLAAGLLGILVTLLLTIPINLIIHKLSGISRLSAVLPFRGGVALIIISVVLTLIAGLIPSRVAANKDPVEALRTE